MKTCCVCKKKMEEGRDVILVYKERWMCEGCAEIKPFGWPRFVNPYIVPPWSPGPWG